MLRKREYIDVAVNEKQIKILKKGRSVIIRLPGGKMMSLAMRDNLIWRRYVRAMKELKKAKRLLKRG